MTKSSKQTRTLLIFYLLAFYVLLQFCWWAFYLTDLNAQIADLSVQLQGPQAEREIRNLAQKRSWMILGEGLVFLSLLGLGIWKVQNNLKKEARFLQLQQNFLLSVTHEIKSPIAALKLALETLEKRSLPEEKQKLVLGQSLQDADRLDLLADKILLAARMESTDQALYPESLDAGEIVRETVERMSKVIGRNHETHIACEDDCLVEVDPQGLRSLVANLYENATKYAPKGTRIEVGCSSEKDGVLITVSDRGPGIPPDEQELVFQKFYRSGNEMTRSTKGTGLGLYIVKQIAELHKAQVSIKPNPEGGSIFVIKFKKA